MLLNELTNYGEFDLFWGCDDTALRAGMSNKASASHVFAMVVLLRVYFNL